MSKIKNDGLTQSGTGCFIELYQYGNNGRQRVKVQLNTLWVLSLPPGGTFQLPATLRKIKYR